MDPQPLHRSALSLQTLPPHLLAFYYLFMRNVHKRQLQNGVSLLSGLIFTLLSPFAPYKAQHTMLDQLITHESEVRR